MANPVLSFTLTPEQWTAAQTAVQQQAGIALNGDSGTASKDGVTLAYAYDAAAQSLTVQVTGREFFDPSADTIDAKLTAAVQAITE